LRGLSSTISISRTHTVCHLVKNYFYFPPDSILGNGSQALALSAYGGQQGYYGVGLYGYQDTLLSEIGNQVYGKCFIEGAVDFVFGQHARMWIDSSDIRVTTGGGIFTANGRASSSGVSYYVIDKSSVSAAQGASVSPGSVYLGRPWSEYARVCFQETVLSSIIAPAGWEVWSSSLSNTAHVTFQEYGNTGSDASGTRASFSSELSSIISISSILGPSYTSWVDRSYLA
jgi:pectinesterase